MDEDSLEKFRATKLTGVEIEVGAVDSLTFEKPFEEDYRRALHASLEKQIKGYKSGLEMDIAEDKKADIRTALDLATLIDDILRYPFLETRGPSLKAMYDTMAEERRDDKGLKSILDILDRANEDGVRGFDYSPDDVLEAMRNVYLRGDTATEKDRIAVELFTALTVGEAFSNMLLPTYNRIMEDLDEEEKKHFTFDISDAIEIVSSPHDNLDDLFGEITQYMETLTDALDQEGLSAIFSGRDPSTKQAGWGETFGARESQNNYGVHVHLGDFNDEFEAAAVYEAFRQVGPEILAMAANSGVVDGEVSTHVSSRAHIYGTAIPPSIPEFGTEMTEEQKANVQEYIMQAFSPSAPSVRFQALPWLWKAMSEYINTGVAGSHRPETLKVHSAVFMRPEYGTVEVRIPPTQTNFKDNSLEGHLQENRSLVELIKGVGQAAVQAYREGNILFDGKDDPQEAYERAAMDGLKDPELRAGARDVLRAVKNHVTYDTLMHFRDKVWFGKSPAHTQQFVHSVGGPTRLYETIIAETPGRQERLLERAEEERAEQKRADVRSRRLIL